MDQTTSRAEPGPRPTSPVGQLPDVPSGGPPSDGLPPEVMVEPVATAPYRWAFARHAVWALPAYALGQLWLALVTELDPAVDPAGWATRVTSGGYQRAQVLVGMGGQLLVLVAVVALAGLVTARRGRGFATAGLLAGLVGVVLAIPRWSMTGIAAPVLGQAFADGTAQTAGWYAQIQARTDPAAFAGAGLLGLGFVLLGIAAWRSRAVGRSDGLLLVVAGPVLVAGQWYEPMLTPLGALPLLAAGVGIAWSAGRPRPA